MEHLCDFFRAAAPGLITAFCGRCGHSHLLVGVVIEVFFRKTLPGAAGNARIQPLLNKFIDLSGYPPIAKSHAAGSNRNFSGIAVDPNHLDNNRSAIRTPGLEGGFEAICNGFGYRYFQLFQGIIAGLNRGLVI